jgi:hypothetical protein
MAYLVHLESRSQRFRGQRRVRIDDGAPIKLVLIIDVESAEFVYQQAELKADLLYAGNPNFHAVAFEQVV